MVVLFSPELGPRTQGQRSGKRAPSYSSSHECPRRVLWEGEASQGEDAGIIPSLPALGRPGHGA